MSRAKRARRTFRAGVEALEGRSALSSGGRFLATHAAHHHKLAHRRDAEAPAQVVPTPTGVVTQTVTVGTPGRSLGQGSSTSSTGTGTGPGQDVHSPALTQVNQRPFRTTVAGPLIGTISTSNSVTTGAGTATGGVTPVSIANEPRDVSLGARTPIVVGTNAGGLDHFTSNLAIQFTQNNGNSTGLISTTNAVPGTGATFGIAFI